MKTLIILPVYKEVENLQILIPKIIDTDWAKEHSIYVIDDNSQDGTKDLINEFQNQHKNIYYLLRPQKLGLGTAYMAGFRFAKTDNYDICITMDSDLSHNPESISNLKNLIINGAHVAVGSRYISGGQIVGWPKHRYALSRGANILSKKLLKLSTNDCTSGFRAYNREAYNFLLSQNFQSHGYALLEEMLYALNKQKFIIRETPICFRERLYGKSKISSYEIIKGARMLLAIARKK